VFLTPPWPEIHHRDSERQQDLKDGIAEHHRLIEAFDWLGYDPSFCQGSKSKREPVSF
jgi:predicted ATPase